MIELLIALAIGIVVIWAIYDLYAFVIRSSSGMDNSLETQLELRSGTERIVKELRAAGCYFAATPVINAEADTIEFESDVDPSNTAGPWRIKYRYDAANRTILRSEAEWNGATLSYGAPSAEMILADNIKALQFTYFDELGNPLTAPLSQADRDLVRKVELSIESETANINQATGHTDTIALQTAVQMRCMGVNQSADQTPCDMVASVLTVTDPHECGSLDLLWDKATSADVAGYRVYYRFAGTSTYTGVFDRPGANNLSTSISGLTDGKQYDIALKCYDTSGNLSTAFTGPVTGISGQADTTPNDTSPPSLPDVVDATASEGLVTLIWTYTVGPSPDLGGYTIYRSSDNGATFPKIGETDSNATGYKDQGAALNCPANPYQYRVTTWDCNSNNDILVGSTAFDALPTVFGDAGRADGITDQPNNGTTNTFPADTLKPADPTGFTATAAATSIFLSYTTPATDVAGTRILVRTDVDPTGPKDAIAYGPNDIKDHAPEDPDQTYSREDLGPTGSPITPDGTTYYYRAFTFDNCGNYSKGLTSSATATPCGDGDTNSDHFGPPAAPKNVQVKSCRSVNLSWDASDRSERTGIKFIPPSESDVVGYNIYRKIQGGSYSATPLNSTPVSLTSYSDSTATTSSTYEYKVTAVDCANKESLRIPPNHIASPNDLKWDPSVVVTLSPTPGVEGSQQNVVTLGIESLGNTSVTIDSAEITWDVVPASLKKVSLIPFGYPEKVLWDDTTLPLGTSGATIDFASFEPTAGNRRLEAASTGNKLILDFRNSSGNPNVDMRLGNTITLTIHYTAEGTNSSCQATVISVPLPSGPTILSATQNKPLGSTQPNHVPGTIVIGAGTQDDNEQWIFDDVEVTVNASPEFGTSISSSTLYYIVTNTDVATSPATDYSDAPAGWTAVPMCQLGGSNTYQTSSPGGCTSQPIPFSPGERVWYYIKVVDSVGNSDIQPEPTVGIYNYDQLKAFTFNPLSVARQGSNTDVEVILKDEGSIPATGATVNLTVSRSTGGGTNNVVMIEDPAILGTYNYPGTGPGGLTSFSSKTIDVSVTADKTGFTQSKCSLVNVPSSNSTSIKSCQ